MNLNRAFANVYDDAARAKAYATLEFPGTYYLAYRDLPEILTQYVTGRHALDFGCGTGRSTRFLKSLGFRTAGIDISRSMLDLAIAADPDGEYHVVGDGDFSPLHDRRFDLILCAFPFDNIAGVDHRTALLRGLRTLLKPAGRIVLLGSRPDIYVNEWASFTTREYPENRKAKSGQQVRIVTKDIPDSRPVVDILWTDDDYRQLFATSGLAVVAYVTPLGRAGERPWISEMRIAPWVIYVLKPDERGGT